ncbi:MAG: hypothetical protein GYB65_15490 [Chloroflexi bacterium]|nr:hypothetical protein [Chloroflexota bacterium]
MIDSAVYLVERVELGLYILAAGGLVWMILRLRSARRDLAVSQFRLERDIAQIKQARSITFSGLLIEFIIAVWAIANLTAPTVRDIRLGNSDGTEGEVQRFVTSTPASNPAVSGVVTRWRSTGWKLVQP